MRQTWAEAGRTRKSRSSAGREDLLEVIELENICKTYYAGDLETPVLRGVSLSISRGDFVALMGPSGSGKTTLMNILGCLDRPTSGRYLLDGEDVMRLSWDETASLRNHKLGFIFQNFNLLPRTSAVDNVRMPLSYGGERLTEEMELSRARELLARVGLTERAHHEPSQLSGGQQQRVAIARALVNRPRVLFADEPTGNLDSKTSAEVLRILEELNEKDGVTIVLVTHDEAVAQIARRVIRIRDGQVESDHRRVPPVEAGFQPPSPARTRPGILSGSMGVLRTSLSGLRRNMMRAALTALGIIIGVGAVIAMMEIGRGSSKSIQQTIESMGANNLIILPGTATSAGVSFGAGSVTTLTPQDAAAVASECPAVRAAAPIVRARTQIVYGNKNWVPSSIYGTTPGFLDVREWSLADGEMFSDRDVRNVSKVCVLGQRIVRELFDQENPIGKEIRLNNVPFRITGVLSRKGANMMGMDQDDILIAPWTTIKYRVAGQSLSNANQSAASSSTDSVNTLSKVYPGGTEFYPAQSSVQQADTPLPVRFTNVDQIVAAAKSGDSAPAAIEQITKVIRERHRIGPGEPEDFNIRDMTEMTKAVSSTSVMMTNLLLIVAMISLIVGGVGIMNIMLVSVTERTREIGLRMAVGATRRVILRQFLAEAVLLCFLGGAAGILLGRGASILVRTLMRWPTELSLDAVAAAFLVSATVGIVFGYYPAWKASRLDPITALRYE